MEDKNK